MIQPRVERLIIEAYTEYHRTLAELALFYGVSIGTIGNVLRRNKVPSRGRGRRRRDADPNHKEFKKTHNESHKQTV